MTATIAPSDRGLGVVAEAVGALHANRTRRARLPVSDKVAYLSRVREQVIDHAEDWIDVGVAHKGVEPHSPIIGSEEWLSGVYVALNLVTDYIRTLSILDNAGDILEGLRVQTLPNGQVAVRAYPTNAIERVLVRKRTIDVLMEPDVTEANLREHLASFYKQADPTGRVTAVLGAGNYAAIPFSDALTYLIVHGDVVALKMNPVNEAYGPVIEAMLEPLIADGYLTVLYGGADVGRALVTHRLVEAVHLTGSEATYNAIVFGTGEDGERRRRDDNPLVKKPVYAELGGASPTIVVPGHWQAADIDRQAEHIASQALHNAGHACISAQVLVMPARWDKREQMLDALRAALHGSPTREAYYPGTHHRRERLHAHSGDAERHGAEEERSLVVGLSPDDDHFAFREELFGPMLVTVNVGGAEPADYLPRAVAFANDRLYGTLGANMIIREDTATQLGPVFRRGVLDLRYGALAINTWSAFAFGSARAAWGAFPGNPRNDIGSGSGFVRNSLMLDRPQRTIAAAPFRDLMAPPWFLSNPLATPLARAVFRFTADSRPRNLPAYLVEAATRR